MGRHTSAQPERKHTPFHRLWRRLPHDVRARVWQWRRRWRSFWDRRHTPRGDWDAQLPRDPANWSEAWDHIGSYAVAAELRRRRAERGDLLPQRPRIEPFQEDS